MSRQKKIRNAFLGLGDDCRLLLQTFDEYHVNGISIKELKRDLIGKFVLYLYSAQGMRSGIHSTIKKLKLVTYTAHTTGFPPILSPGSMSKRNTRNVETAARRRGLQRNVRCGFHNCCTGWRQVTEKKQVLF
ncbi:hypothetical protein [Alistipes onderdonkii]|uniref:hypothetical protein n=1 Tax=Alistipes onderdonkii TaxID=328813 RepID=UPI0036F22A91